MEKSTISKENGKFKIDEFKNQVDAKVKEIELKLKNKENQKDTNTNGNMEMVKEIIKDKKWIDDYIDGMEKYQKNMIKNGNFTSKYLEFLEDMNKRYKENREIIKTGMETLIDEIGKEKEEGCYELMDKLQKGEKRILKRYKKTNKSYKMAVGRENVWRIETLAHNLLYTKQGNVKNSKKIGFLDFLLGCLSGGSVKFEDLKKKLRFPFNKITLKSNAKDVAKCVDKVVETLKKDKINDAGVFKTALQSVEKDRKRIIEPIKTKRFMTDTKQNEYAVEREARSIRMYATEINPRTVLKGYGGITAYFGWKNLNEMIRMEIICEAVVAVLKSGIHEKLKGRMLAILTSATYSTL